MDFKQLGDDLLGGAVGTIGSLGVGALVNGIGSLFSHEKATAPSDLLNNQYVSLGKVGNKKQTRAMESQARLAALQQYYAEKNNQQDLQNQMFMTRSAAELEAAGKRSAGLSTAGDFNGESVSSPTISSPGFTPAFLPILFWNEAITMFARSKNPSFRFRTLIMSSSLYLSGFVIDS